VDDGATGKVEAGNFAIEGGVEKSALAPHHVRHGRIDDDGPQGEEQAHGAEFHALGEGSGDEGRRDDGEHELVDHVGLRRDGCAVVGIGSEPDVMHKCVMESANEAVAGSKGEAVADQSPEHGDDAHHGKALHHGGEHIFAANQAAVEERKSRAGHHQDQGGAGEHPGVIAGGDGGGRGRLSHGDRGATKREKTQQPNQATRVHITPLAWDGNMSRRGDR
jgi:hypothetical protein